MEKVVCLVSGGIDSPVACALAAQTFEIVPLHFCLYPYTCEDTFFTAMRVLKHLKEKTGFEKVVVFPWQRVLRAILRGTGRYACLACRKGMFRVAERICEQESATGIVTGESLGQKASQTLWNLAATSRGIRFPILRPLLGFDKVETERLSRKLDLWHDVHAGCCYATPKHPSVRGDPGKLDRLLERLRVDDLISEEFHNTLEVLTFEEDFEGYLERLI
jgi:thiamine biosynthesis protein ThiI